MADPKKLVIAPDKLAFAVVGPARDIVVDLLLSPYEASLVGIPLALRMSPSSARQFAAALIQKADEAESEGLAGPRH
jgi:hypothetical protein